MKILHTSDWHIGKFLHSISLLSDQAAYLERLRALLLERRVDVLLISGDLYDRSVPSAEAVTLLDDFFYDLVVKQKIQVLCIAGNHDSGERLSFANRLYRESGFYICGAQGRTVEKVTLRDEWGDVHFYLIPYLEPAKLRSLFPDKELKTFDDAYSAVFETLMRDFASSERNVLLAHGLFSFLGEESPDARVFSASEVSVGGADLVNAARFAPFDYAALGHLHAPQQVGRAYIRYAGSLLKYAVEESEQKKSLPLVTLSEKGNLQLELVELAPLRDLQRISGAFDELLNGEDGTEDYVFVELTDREPVPDAAAKLRVRFPNILGVRYLERQLTEERVLSPDAIARKTPEALFSDFFRYVTGSPPDAEQEKMAKDVFDAVKKGAL